MPDKPGVPMTPPKGGGGGSQGTPAHPGNKGNPPVDRPWEPDRPGGPVNPPDTPIGKGPDFPFKPGNPPPPSNPPPPEQPPQKPREPNPPPPEQPPQKPREPNPPPPSENPGTPGPPLEPSPNPQGPGTGGDFSKGQPYEDVTGASKGQPPSDFYGDDGFDPYFGRNTGIKPGGGATSYDPLGIGKDAYTDPNADVWSMTGVNSVLAPGSKVKPRYGVVGGNGGYGYGMVGQDYSGPLANDPRGLVRNLRQQRRQLNRMGHARGGPGVVDGPGGFGPKTGGAGTVTGGSGGQFGPAGDDMNNFKGQPAGGSGGGATGGAGTTTGGQGGKWGAPPPAAGANGAQPEAGTGMGPSTSALDAALPGGAQANGTPGKPGMIWWNGVEIPNQGNYTDQFGNITTKDEYAKRVAAVKSGNMTGLSPSLFNTPYGELTQASGGNSNVFKRNGGDENTLYHWDPQHQWRSMTLDEYKGYGDYNYQNPLSSEANARAAGAQEEVWGRPLQKQPPAGGGFGAR